MDTDGLPPPARPAYQWATLSERHSRPAPAMDHRAKPAAPGLRPDIAATLALAEAARLRAALACTAAKHLQQEAARLRERRRGMPGRPPGPATRPR